MSELCTVYISKANTMLQSFAFIRTCLTNTIWSEVCKRPISSPIKPTSGVADSQTKKSNETKANCSNRFNGTKKYLVGHLLCWLDGHGS